MELFGSEEEFSECSIDSSNNLFLVLLLGEYYCRLFRAL